MHPEGTVGRLRYALGGDRPSQTTPLALSGRRLYGRPLDANPRESGISPAPPRPPRGAPRRLPPILRRRGLAPRPGCSKAPRGLFVLPRVTRIFTGTSISPSPPSRQRPSRYAFRAGRNLPDKEFRYLRTVIVTAAVHRGFRSGLRAPLPFTFRHWAGISPYTSARAVAETCVFGKQSLGPAPCGPLALPGAPPPAEADDRPVHAAGAPLLPKLRGQIAEFLNGGSLVHLGVLTPAHRCRCAVRAVRAATMARGFSRRPAHPTALPHPHRVLASRLGARWVPPDPGFAWDPPYTGRPALSIRPAAARYRVPPSPLRARCRNVHLLAIAYAARTGGLDLGPD
jgi:hypothetical protein